MMIRILDRLTKPSNWKLAPNLKTEKGIVKHAFFMDGYYVGVLHEESAEK